MQFCVKLKEYKPQEQNFFGHNILKFTIVKKSKQDFSNPQWIFFTTLQILISLGVYSWLSNPYNLDLVE